MKLCRFDNDRLGLVTDNEIEDVSDVLALLPPQRWPYPPGDLLITHLDEIRAAIENRKTHGPKIPVDKARLRSPVANPGKIIGAPANYSAHVEEAKRDAGIHHGVHNHGYDPKSPIARLGLFLKATSSVVGVCEGITFPATDKRIDHEVEICAVIGAKARNVPPENALDIVAGYTLGLDMSVRGPQDRSFRKSLDSFTLLGPWLVTADEMPALADARFGLSVNGEKRQESAGGKMIVDTANLIALASATYTLYPGDVLMTGTPEGVGPVKPGDFIRAWCAGIGAFEAAVRAA